MPRKRSGKVPKVRDVVAVMHEIAPPELAEDWDNVGLQLGDPEAPASRVLTALEVTSATVREATKRRASLLLVHHPLIFRPLSTLSEEGTVQRLAAGLIRGGIALLAAHTNVDSVAWGTNGELADRLGLNAASRRFLRPAPTPGTMVKVVVFVPVTHIEPMIEAFHRGGAGNIGDYSHCTFRTPGTGTYKPLEGATPWHGKVGDLEHANEVRMEAVCPSSILRQVIQSLRAAHPYEEMAFDVFPLEDAEEPKYGLGLIGELSRPHTVDAVARKLKRSLGVKAIRRIGDGRKSVRRIALCSGGGGEFVRNWKPGTADLYVTGEMAHHDCLEASENGLPVLLVGHWVSEAIASARVAATLGGALSAKGFTGCEVLASRVERSPITEV